MSIDTSELRIGNYVQSNDGNLVLKVDYIHDDFFGAESLDNSNIYDSRDFEMKPIPICDNSLEDFGFEYHAFKGGYVKYLGCDPYTYLIYDLSLKGLNQRIGQIARQMPVNSIHSLQNLYHSLTGKELTLEKTDEEKACDVLQDIIDEAIKKYAEQESEPDRIQRQLKEMLSDAPTANEFCEYLAKLYDRYKNG